MLTNKIYLLFNNKQIIFCASHKFPIQANSLVCFIPLFFLIIPVNYSKYA